MLKFHVPLLGFSILFKVKFAIFEKSRKRVSSCGQHSHIYTAYLKIIIEL